jgi:cation:H+ antiporter
MAVFLLILGFVLLVKGADFLVDGASSLAKKLNVSELAIGLTVVAFGTSTPELVVNIIASARTEALYDEVVFGNVIGSNNFNLLLILGIAGIVYPVTVQVKTVWKEIPYSILAGLILFALVNDSLLRNRDDNYLVPLEGAVLLIFFALFIIYVLFNLKAEKEQSAPHTRMFGMVRTVVYLVCGLAGLIIGGRVVVKNAVEIAHSLGVSEKFIGLTIVSVGTSLPELATSVVAISRRKSDLAIGNVIGSNIFNIFLILGVSSIISPLVYNTAFNVDILVYIFSTAFLFIAMFTGGKKKLDRWEAGILILFFAAYMTFLLWRK